MVPETLPKTGIAWVGSRVRSARKAQPPGRGEQTKNEKVRWGLGARQKIMDGYLYWGKQKEKEGRLKRNWG